MNLIPLCAPGYMLGLSTLEAVQWMGTSLLCLQGQSFDPTGAGGASLFGGWRFLRHFARSVVPTSALVAYWQRRHEPEAPSRSFLAPGAPESSSYGRSALAPLLFCLFQFC